MLYYAILMVDFCVFNVVADATTVHLTSIAVIIYIKCKLLLHRICLPYVLHTEKYCNTIYTICIAI